jgi:uncharacterized membrane protein
MRLHPLHPMSVHFPIACIVFTPLLDLWAGSGFTPARAAGALSAGGALAFGVIAASFGALEGERGYAASPRLVIAHASLMTTAILLCAISLAGRVRADLSILSSPTPWAVAASALALLVMAAGAALGGEMVYGRGVGVRERPHP